MRCTRCNYTTFDYLESCPKCHADRYEDRSRLNFQVGPPQPISLTTIMARAQTSATFPSVAAPAPPEKTVKLEPADYAGPKTFDLDLSRDTAVESLAEKWIAKANGIPERKAVAPALDLSLE